MSASRDTRERILDSAAELFAERGYGGTTTRAIAERAGVNEVTLFRHFGNKQGVLVSLTERFAERSAARNVAELPDPADIESTLLAIARNEIEASIENGGVALRLAFDAKSVPEVAALMGEGPRANIDALSAYMADRQAAGDLRSDVEPIVLAELFAAMTSSYVMYRMIMGFLDKPEEVASEKSITQLVSVFFDGARSGSRCGS